jgi:hypothetical protein
MRIPAACGNGNDLVNLVRSALQNGVVISNNRRKALIAKGHPAELIELAQRVIDHAMHTDRAMNRVYLSKTESSYTIERKSVQSMPLFVKLSYGSIFTAHIGRPVERSTTMVQKFLS